jgi:hypothetical protein
MPPVTQRCATLAPPPADTSVDTVLYREEGILEVWFTKPRNGKSVHYAIRYLTDETCRNEPAFRQLIARSTT